MRGACLGPHICIPAQLQLRAQCLAPERHLGTKPRLLRSSGGVRYGRAMSTAPFSLIPGGSQPGACTMIKLDSWTSGRLCGTREMVTLAVTETVVPEGLIVQRGGAVARSSSFSGESISAGV